MKKSYLITFVFSIILIVIAIHFQNRLFEFKTLGLLGIFLINFFGNATLFLPAPAIASVVAGGGVYPPLSVAFISAIGAAIGDMVGFVLGYSGKEVFIKNHHKIYLFLRAFFKQYGDAIIFLFALIPNPFFDFIGIVAGVFKVSFYRFFIFLFLGRLIRNIMLAFFGSALFS